MGYLYLTAALFAGVAKGFCGKTISRDMKSMRECLFINLMRMLFCALIGFLLALPKAGLSLFSASGSALGIFVLAGLSMSTFCVAWMFAYRNEAYMFLSIFTMLGTVVTCLLDYAVYKTPISAGEWLGMGVLFGAVLIMSKYNKGIAGRLHIRGLLILIVGSVGSALADFSQKIYVREIGQGAEIFNFYMYAFGFLLLFCLYLFISVRKSTPKTAPILYSRHHIGLYFAMAFFLYLNSVTKTMAAGFLSAAQIYPVLQGANLILSALMAHLLFKEKMNLKGFCGILTAFTGLMLMHIA
ncbi:MAG: EamA family transporter [Clostridia bacterium]|nr:EamA family transporter [Clostridia bacterium]